MVTTVYKSEKFLNEFIDNCIESLNKINCVNYELIFVNDGSPDASLDILLSKKEVIPGLKILNLSRNFGHHYAALAGLNYSSGEYVFLIDCDLEVQPQILIKFYEKILNNNVDVVYGYQEKRGGGILSKITGNLFWYLINLLSDFSIPSNIITERLMKRKYVESLLKLGDKNLFLGGMMYWTGYVQIGLSVNKKKRSGKFAYSFFDRLRLMLEAITSFSTFPLKVMFYFGLSLSSMSFCCGLLMIIRKLIWPEEFLSGYVSTIIIVVFFSGITEVSIGLLGIYIGRIYKQVQNRPLYIVKDIY